MQVVSERLGHASVQITEDIYTHVLPHMQTKAAHAVETWWKQAASKSDKVS